MMANNKINNVIATFDGLTSILKYRGKNKEQKMESPKVAPSVKEAVKEN